MNGQETTTDEGQRPTDGGGVQPTTRRTRLLRLGVPVLVALVLLGVPAYLTSRPAYFGAIDSLADQYEPWSTSTHLEAGCEGCHVAPGLLSRSAYRIRMVGEFYLGLVARSRQPAVFATPTNDACLACHNDLRTVSPVGDLQIPHRAHVSILKMACVECHNYLVHAHNPAGKHAPTMAGCLTCHDGDTAKDSCWACHTAKAAPPSHRTAGWLVTHGHQVPDPACNDCHEWTENWCVDCHLQRPRSHTTDWRAIHGLAVKQHRSCEACHGPGFCEPCHGEVPQLNFDPALVLVE